jgi:DNA-binding transcriptional ArsR family regulator
MSQSPLAASPIEFPGSSEGVTVTDDASAVRDVLAALDDADCRAVLEATSDDALSATELAEACDLPLSTTYRKLDLLTDTGLVEERTRVRRSGKHLGEYARTVEEVAVSLDEDGGMELQVTRRERSDPLP